MSGAVVIDITLPIPIYLLSGLIAVVLDADPDAVLDGKAPAELLRIALQVKP